MFRGLRGFGFRGCGFGLQGIGVWLFRPCLGSLGVREAGNAALLVIRVSKMVGNAKHQAITHRLHSSSFLGSPYRILNMNPKKELLWSLWV